MVNFLGYKISHLQNITNQSPSCAKFLPRNCRLDFLLALLDIQLQKMIYLMNSIMVFCGPYVEGENG
jgi:hypothetical protein